MNFLYRDEEFQGISTDQLRHTEGNVILHITFAVKQDQQLGKEFVKYLKVCTSTYNAFLELTNICPPLTLKLDNK